MTELATIPAASGLTALPQTADVIQLHEWAAELNAAHQLGKALALSSFLPMSLRMKGKNNFKTVEELTNDAAAVILAGKSVGLDPMQSVQNIFPVHGMPSMYARTMVALVIAEGHEMERTAASEDSVTWQARRKGSDRWQEFTWTIGRAKKAGYTSNAKYQSDPIAMLGAKAAAEACRTVFPDVLLGMAYSVEDMELEDMGEVAPAPAAPAASEKPKRTVRRQQAPAPAVPGFVHEAPRDEAESVQEEPATEPESTEPLQEPGCSMGQQKALGDALKKAGHSTKEDMMLVVSSWAGREITASRELTVTEAKDLTTEILDSLNQKEGQA